MSNHNEYQQFLPEDNFDRDRLIVDVPTAPDSLYVDKIPAGYLPMEIVYSRGRSYRRFANGRAPWWVLIAGWILYGSLILSVIVPLLVLGSVAHLPILGFAVIPTIILWRGTRAKLSSKERKW